MCPVIVYGAPVWGTECYSCIQAVQHRAARYFLNVGKYSSVAAMTGDTNWYPLECKLCESVLNHWCCCVNMNSSRLNKRIFKWCVLKRTNACRNWNFRVRKQFHKYNCQENYQVLNPIEPSFICSSIEGKVYADFVKENGTLI